MNLLDLEQIHQNHRKELETKLSNATNNIQNLDRMAQQCFKEIDKRCQEDMDRLVYRSNEAKENFAIIFMALTKAEETAIDLLREELGLDKLLPAPQQKYEQEFNENENKTIDVSTELSTRMKAIKTLKGVKRNVATI